MAMIVMVLVQNGPKERTRSSFSFFSTNAIAQDSAEGPDE
jgi:hypothetical protein